LKLLKGVQIVKAASQYATDLQKCILRVEEHEESEKGNGEMDIVILGGLSGRLDQTMHTLHVLCQVAESESHQVVNGSDTTNVKKSKNKGLDENDFVTLERRKKAWVVSENSLVWILSKVSKGWGAKSNQSCWYVL
jgi:thiamine pyrophosphokinase